MECGSYLGTVLPEQGQSSPHLEQEKEREQGEQEPHLSEVFLLGVFSVRYPRLQTAMLPPTHAPTTSLPPVPGCTGPMAAMGPGPLLAPPHGLA